MARIDVTTRSLVAASYSALHAFMFWPFEDGTYLCSLSYFFEDLLLHDTEHPDVSDRYNVQRFNRLSAVRELNVKSRPIRSRPQEGHIRVCRLT